MILFRLDHTDEPNLQCRKFRIPVYKKTTATRVIVAAEAIISQTHIQTRAQQQQQQKNET